MHDNSLVSPTGEYFEGSYFANYGYWDPDTKTAKQSCENLMDRLLAYIPRKTGRILEVACGLGATTRHMLRFFPAEAITAIDLTPKNLEVARGNAPGVEFIHMDATRLDFRDATFDHVISVEAAFHFATRERFLREARRVLKPGGRIVLADVLHDKWADSVSRMLHPENHVRDPQSYRLVLKRCGYEEIVVDDVTEQSWTRSNEAGVRFLVDKFHAGALDRKSFNRLMSVRLSRLVSTRYYLLASALRPLNEKLREGVADPEAIEFDAGFVGPEGARQDGMQVILQHAKWSHAERLLRLVQTAAAERMIEKIERGEAPRPRPAGGPAARRRRPGRGGAR
jgi:ubiquinone/menaquinone biosynthesis C-methylase UbiE